MPHPDDRLVSGDGGGGCEADPARIVVDDEPQTVDGQDCGEVVVQALVQVGVLSGARVALPERFDPELGNAEPGGGDLGAFKYRDRRAETGDQRGREIRRRLRKRRCDNQQRPPL